MASSHLIFFGTYTRAASRGIYAAQLNDETGALTAPVLAAETANPTWLEFSPDRKVLFAVHPSKAQVVSFTIDAAQAKLTPLPQPPTAKEDSGAPCHLAVDATGRMLIAVNYGGSFIESLAIHADGTLGEPKVINHSGQGPNPLRQDKPHPHSATISPDNRFVIVCDLGLDRLFTYAIDPVTAALTPANPPFVAAEPGSGPRHFKFGADGRHAYCLSEMGSTAAVYNYDATRGALSPTQSISTLPAEYGAKWGAEVRVHPNGKFLYASNRGHDSIAVFAIEPATGKLTLVEIVHTGGEVPRNFALSPNGKWLVCAHQFSGDVTVFKVDGDSGRLTANPHRINVPMGICVLFYN